VLVYGAALFLLEEDAVVVRPLLEAQFVFTNLTRAGLPKLGLSHTETARQGKDIVVGDPHHTRCTTAAFSAAGAFETEAVVVPGLRGHGRKNTPGFPVSRCPDIPTDFFCTLSAAAGVPAEADVH